MYGWKWLQVKMPQCSYTYITHHVCLYICQVKYMFMWNFATFYIPHHIQFKCNPVKLNELGVFLLGEQNKNKKKIQGEKKHALGVLKDLKT